MESTVNGSQLSMKILFDKKSKKVLFAEAGKEVIDFLFYILSLPLATATKLLSKSKIDMNGCLNNLYASIENLDHKYFQSAERKDFILNPKPSFPVQAPLLISDTVSRPNTTKVYKCPNSTHNVYYSIDSTATCRTCYVRMSILEGELIGVHYQGEGIVKDFPKYMVMDDLVIKPTSSSSSISLLKDFSIKYVNNIQEIVVDLGIDEGIKILKASLEGKEVLTSVFIHNQKLDSIVNNGKLSMKIIFDNENKKVLFAEAEKDVIDFLFYLLSLPLAMAMRLLSESKIGMNSCLNNLYVSFEKLDNNYIETVEKKNFILKPKPSFPVQAPLLISNTVSHPSSTNFYRCHNSTHSVYYSINSITKCVYCSNIMSTLHGELVTRSDQGGGFVKGLVKYMVMDDFMIKPVSLISDIGLLKEYNIEDVNNLQEIVVDLGIDECLEILKTSLEGQKTITSIFIHKLVEELEDQDDEDYVDDDEEDDEEDDDDESVDDEEDDNEDKTLV
ncbi:uncharacterized protein LOC124935253 [Impatiens glandulifera]|uniref:uncharacterized protein LOC124935253 n=1 Tax=Impatiens glandulifera TaxID=253017 RepID=UPI001FB0A7F9|nr:uncharacterized protein LOC124935253 [Impatiens glandulifera]